MPAQFYLLTGNCVEVWVPIIYPDSALLAANRKKDLGASMVLGKHSNCSGQSIRAPQFLLMDPSASFDILVVDPSNATLVAIEVKAPRASSPAARRLTKSQREMNVRLNQETHGRFFIEGLSSTVSQVGTQTQSSSRTLPVNNLRIAEM
jgi:hypothetical protein